MSKTHFKIYFIFSLIFSITMISSCKKEELKENHTVSFDSNGGSKIETQIIRDYSIVSEPTPPTKEEFLFSEWQLDGKKYEFFYRVTKDITLKAKWGDRITYQVTFNSNGGNEIPSQTILMGEKAKEPIPPSKADSIFSEWHLNAKVFSFGTPIIENITLNAKWIAPIDGSSSDWETIVSGSDVIITKYTGSDTNVVIPTTIDGKKIVAIGDNATESSSGVFSQNSNNTDDNISSIDMSNTIYLEKINLYAFSYCQKLISVKFNQSLKTIGKSSFRGCSILDKVIFPTGLELIEEHAFVSCLNLRTITLTRTQIPLTDTDRISPFFFQTEEKVAIITPLEEIFYPKSADYKDSYWKFFTVEGGGRVAPEFWPNNKLIPY